MNPRIHNSIRCLATQWARDVLFARRPILLWSPPIQLGPRTISSGLMRVQLEAGINAPSRRDAYLNTGPTSPSFLPNLNSRSHGFVAPPVPSENVGPVTRNRPRPHFSAFT
jgi:hypothetical protein